MKSLIVKSSFAILMALLLCPLSASAYSTQVDPVLTGALATQFNMLKRIFNRRDSTQKKIIAAETAVTVAYTRMHDVEKKVLDYMSNVQAGFQNLYQIKKAAELVTVDIPKNMNYVRQSISYGGFEGTFMAAAVGKELTNITLDITSLYPFMAQLVTSGSYNVKGSDGKDVEHKVNLLNSAERYYVANTILSKLENINTSLYCLGWEIKCYRFRDLFRKLDPVGWANVMEAKWIVKGVVRDWNYELAHW